MGRLVAYLVVAAIIGFCANSFSSCATKSIGEYNYKYQRQLDEI